MVTPLIGRSVCAAISLLAMSCTSVSSYSDRGSPSEASNVYGLVGGRLGIARADLDVPGGSLEFRGANLGGMLEVGYADPDVPIEVGARVGLADYSVSTSDTTPGLEVDGTQVHGAIIARLITPASSGSPRLFLELGAGAHSSDLEASASGVAGSGDLSESGFYGLLAPGVSLRLDDRNDLRFAVSVELTKLDDTDVQAIGAQVQWVVRF